MKKIKPFKEKPGLKRFEIDIYWEYGRRTVVRKMVAPSHEIAGERLMRSLGLQIKRSHVVTIGTHQLGSSH